MIEKSGLKNNKNLVNQIPLECPFNPYRDVLFWTKDKDHSRTFSIDPSLGRSNSGQVNSGTTTRRTIEEPSDQVESSSSDGGDIEGHPSRRESYLQNQGEETQTTSTSDEEVVQSSNSKKYLSGTSQPWINQYFGHSTNDANNVREHSFFTRYSFFSFSLANLTIVVFPLFSSSS